MIALFREERQSFFDARHLYPGIVCSAWLGYRTALRWVKWLDPYRLPMAVCSRLSTFCGHRIGSKFPRHAKVVAALEMLPHDLFDQLFKFAFVRNPWDLQVSSDHHIRRERPHLLHHIHNFEDFIRWKLDVARPYHYIIDTSIQRQTDYLIDQRGKIIVDIIGHYEALEKDFDRACGYIGIPCPPLPHKRKARDRRDYRTYYNDCLAEAVGSHFRQDIEMLGYRFNRPAADPAMAAPARHTDWGMGFQRPLRTRMSSRKRYCRSDP